MQIEDPYRTPTKFWQFCHFLQTASEVSTQDAEEYVMLQSYLNMLKVIQITNGAEGDLKFQINVTAVEDEDVVQKVKSVNHKIYFFLSMERHIICY